jgi:hypothetical protein
MNYTNVCGCRVVKAGKTTEIIYCPKHKAAGDMYEALKDLWSALMFNHLAADGKFGVMYAERVESALAKAEGK